MTDIWTDNPAGLSTNLQVFNEVDIGTAQNPLGTLYVNQIVGAALSGDVVTSPDGLSVFQVGDANTQLNLHDPSGQLIIYGSGGGTKLYFDQVNGLQLNALPVTALAYNLLDGSALNHSLTSFASGTAYSLTNSSAQLVFGTSNAQIALDKAGTYLLLARVNLEYAGATFAANQAVTLKLRRTNNTAADVTGSSTSLGTRVVTTQTGIMASASLPPVVYTTANTNDIITIFGDVAVAPSAGALNATEANIVAIRIA